MLFSGVVRVHPDAERAGAWKALVMPRARTQSTARNIILLVKVLRKVGTCGRALRKRRSALWV